MKRQSLLIIISIALYQTIYSQNDFRKGYIVSLKNDTINGYVAYKENDSQYKTCHFKLAEDQELSKYDPSQILGYRYLNDKVFISKEVIKEDLTKEKAFLEILVKGKATLYGYLGVFYIEMQDKEMHKLIDEKVLVEKNGKEYYKNSNRHIAALSYLLADCESIKEKINKVTYRELKLTKLIELYNECDGGESISFKVEKPGFKTEFGLVIGMNSSQLNFSSDLHNTEHLTNGFNRENSMMPGIYFDFSSPRLNERTSINIGLFYIPATYTSYTIVKSSSTLTDYNNVTIEVEQLKIPLAFRYTFPEKKITPYINLGGSYTYHLSSSSLWVQERDANNTVITYEREPIEIGDGQLGFWGGFGVKKSLGNKIGGFMEVRLEQTSGLAVENPILYGDDTLTNIQFLIGITY